MPGKEANGCLSNQRGDKQFAWKQDICAAVLP